MLDLAGCRPRHLRIGNEGDGLRPLVARKPRILRFQDAAWTALEDARREELKGHILKGIDREIRGIVNEAADFAQKDPEPALAELYTNVIREA